MEIRNGYKKGEGMKKMEGTVMKHLFVGYFVAMLMPCTTIFGAAGGDQENKGVEAGRDITTNTQAPSYVLSCAGTGAICNYALNAVGDLKEIDIPLGTPIYQLGTIIKPKTVEIMLPTVGSKKGFVLTLSKPVSSDALDAAMVGVPIEVLLVSSEPDGEALKQSANAQSMVKVYRRMKGSELLWTEMATVVNDGDVTQVPATAVINADGNTAFTVYKKPITIPFGKAVTG